MPKPPRQPSAKPSYHGAGIRDDEGKELTWCGSCGVLVVDEDLHDDRHRRSLALVTLPNATPGAHRNHHPPEGPPSLESEAVPDPE